MVVEPNMGFCKQYGCLVTPLLVDIRDKVTICVRLLNPFPDPIRIPAEVAIRHLEPGTVKKVVREQEHAGEDNNNYDCRRLTLGSNTNDARARNPVLNDVTGITVLRGMT